MANDGWILCSDRLPKLVTEERSNDTCTIKSSHSAECIVTYALYPKDGSDPKIEVSSDFLFAWQDEKPHWGNFEGAKYDGIFDVIAWQPMPKPYIPDKEETK